MLKKMLPFLETMDMPDPYFPIKIHRVLFQKYGEILFHHHWHEHIEFLFFIEGEAMIECNSEQFRVQAGDLIVLNSTDLHHGISMSENLFYYAIIADTSLLHSHSVDVVEMKYITPIAQKRISFQNKISNDNAVNSCITSLIQEFEHGEFGYELAVKSDLYRLLTILLRKYIVRLLEPSEYQLRVKNLERFDPIYQYIEDHYAEKINVDDLAKQMNMSRFYFSRLFKELTGKTVSEYVNFVRINKSEYLLRNTAMSISEIAHATGFNDIYYFSRLFKTYKKVAPSQIRRGSVDS